MELSPEPDTALPSARDWSQLPLDVLSSLFDKLGAIEVLMGAGLVCHSWVRAAKVVPKLWRSVYMMSHPVVAEKHPVDLCAMAKAAVDRSDGQLEVFAAKQFVTDDLLDYIGDMYRTDTLVHSAYFYLFSDERSTFCCN
jgi:hypothetical protein